MPPKKKAKVYNAKASERARARASNLHYLEKALLAVKSDNQSEEYSSTGHVFVAVDKNVSSKSIGQADLTEYDHDPLDLSQGESQEKTMIVQDAKFTLDPATVSETISVPYAASSFIRSPPAAHIEISSIRFSQPVPVEHAAPSSSSSQELSCTQPVRLKSKVAVGPPTSLSTLTTSTTLPLTSSVLVPSTASKADASSQAVTPTPAARAFFSKGPQAVHLTTLSATPAAIHQHTQEFQNSSLASMVQLPQDSSEIFATSSKVPPVTLTADAPAHSSKKTSALLMSPHVQASSSNTLPVSSFGLSPIEYPSSPSSTASPSSPTPLQPLNDSTDEDEGSKDEKYAKLLSKHLRQKELFNASRKKNARFKLEVAELKDIVVHAVAEAKKARTGENANTFTHDPDIDMTVGQIEKVNTISRSVATFAQNLAMHLYGAENLREMSVKGRASNRTKNTPDDHPPRPGISPKKLQFIYAKARERVALEVGVHNLGQIKTLSNESLINKAIAEKIANLRKAAKHAQNRNNTAA
ncbi:uncharacterized protein LOC134216334 [Armigeres subalbatus]|uniref:uncharacterized protein LOC134216334 n=1 Tax=Armigeres subalbatus TaxID=124917 RepID=UPI002ED6629D